MAGSKGQRGTTAANSVSKLRKSTTRRVLAILLVLLAAATLRLAAHDKKGIQYGMGLIVNLPFPASEVEQVLQDVAQNGIIRGTKEYNRDEYITGAEAVESTKVFPVWNAGGKVFYKVKPNTLDPRNFKDSQDVGTIAVRYVLQPQTDKNCVLRIDAVFVEDFRRIAHASDGSVEGAEYKDIHDHLDAIEAMKEQTAEALKVKQRKLAAKSGATPLIEEGSSSSREGSSSSREAQSTLASQDSSGTGSGNPPSQNAESTNSAASSQIPQNQPAQNSSESEPISPRQAFSSQATSNPTTSSQPTSNRTTADPISPSPERPPAGQTADERLQYLRQQIERKVKSPGAPLKSAPFHTASTLQSLPTGTEVLILVSTPYWLGVETHEGQHGWILRDQLEQMP